jgi:hypothetical protein
MESIELEYCAYLKDVRSLVAKLRSDPLFTNLRESEERFFSSSQFESEVERFVQSFAKRKIVFGAMSVGIPTDILKAFGANVRNESFKQFIISNSPQTKVMGLSGNNLNADYLHATEAGSNNIGKKSIPGQLLPYVSELAATFTPEMAKAEFGVEGPNITLLFIFFMILISVFFIFPVSPPTSLNFSPFRLRWSFQARLDVG